MKNQAWSEADLHAYVDGRLPADRQAEIDVLLGELPEVAERVSAYREQKAALRQLFAPVLDEPVPAALQELTVRPSGRRLAWSRWPLQRLAASLLLTVAGGIAGWVGHAHWGTPPVVAQLPSLPRQAAVAHVVFSPDVRRPVEISAEHEDQLVTWLSKRLGTPMRPPKLGALGFELIGGRLLPGNRGPVAQFMYHDASGQRLTLYVSNEQTANRDTAFRFAQEGPVNVFYWVDGRFGYALSAGIPKNDLARVATAVYDQLEARSAPQ